MSEQLQLYCLQRQKKNEEGTVANKRVEFHPAAVSIVLCRAMS